MSEVLTEEEQLEYEEPYQWDGLRRIIDRLAAQVEQLTRDWKETAAECGHLAHELKKVDREHEDRLREREAEWVVKHQPVLVEMAELRVCLADARKGRDEIYEQLEAAEIVNKGLLRRLEGER